MSWPCGASRSGWAATMPSSSAIASAWRPSASPASIRSSRHASRSSSRWAASTRANGWSNSAERRAPPQAQRLLEQRRRLLGVARGERGAPPLPQAAEADRVDALGVGDERVAGRAGEQHVRGQHLAQLRDRDLHHLHRRGGHVLAPQVVDEARHRHGAVEVEDEAGEQRALALTCEPERPLPVTRLQGPEDAELHGWSLPTLPDASGAGHRRAGPGTPDPCASIRAGSSPSRS